MRHERYVNDLAAPSCPHSSVKFDIGVRRTRHNSMLTDMRLNQMFLAGAYFTAFVLILCSLTYFFVMQGHVRLILEALLALPVGVLILWLLRPIEMPVLFWSSAIAALLFMVIVPRAITFHYIDQSAKSVSGGEPLS
jgi:hypothetical protein